MAAALAALSQVTRGKLIIRASEPVDRDDVAGGLGDHHDPAVRVTVTPVRLLLGLVACVVNDGLHVVGADAVLCHLLLGMERIPRDDAGGPRGPDGRRGGGHWRGARGRRAQRRRECHAADGEARAQCPQHHVSVRYASAIEPGWVQLKCTVLPPQKPQDWPLFWVIWPSNTAFT